MAAHSKKIFIFCAMIPVIIFFGLFFYYPFIKNIYYMFTNFNYLNKPEWVGLENITHFFKDKDAHRAIINTFLITLCSVPLMICFSLLLAVLIDRVAFGKTFMRSCIFATYLVSSVVAAIIFKCWFNEQLGLINSTLAKFGIDKIAWLTETKFSIIAIIILAVWLKTGYYFVIFLAGVSNIDQSLYEAAQIDGANSLQRFFSITLPQLKPITILVSIMATISGLKTYSEVVVLTNGGPYKTTQTAIMYMFECGFDRRNVGYGATIAIVMFIIILLITAIQMKTQKFFAESDE